MLFRISHFPAKKGKKKRTQNKESAQREKRERVIKKKEICENLLKFENGLEDRSLVLGERLAKSRIMPDSGKQKDYVHFGIIMRPIRHINCFLLCADPLYRKEEKENARGKRKLPENEDRKLHCD